MILTGVVFLAAFSLFLFSGTLPIYLFRDHGYSTQSVGLLVGVGFLTQIVATMVAGPLIDRRGARLTLRVGPGLYVLAAVLFLLSAAPFWITVARVLQGIGIAMILPAAFAVVPSLASPRYRATTFGIVGVTQNLGLAAGPPLGLWLLSHGPSDLFLTAAVAAAASLALAQRLSVGRPPSRPSSIFSYQGHWTPLLTMTFLTAIYWGVIVAFLPIYVSQHHGGNVGWFFSADAAALVLLRVPSGFLADHFGGRWLILGGIGLTLAGIVLLLAPVSLAVLLVSGAATGAGAALFVPSLLLEVSATSDDSNRGTGMALFSMSFAAALGVGSLAGAPFVAHFGFLSTLMFTGVCCLASAPIALASVHRAHG